MIRARKYDIEKHSIESIRMNGLIEFIKYLDDNREPLIEKPIYISTDKNETPVEIALQYNTSFSENVHSYVNNINTIEGRQESAFPHPYWMNYCLRIRSVSETIHSTAFSGVFAPVITSWTAVASD